MIFTSSETWGIGLVMTDTDQEREDEVLRRMLATKPKPHKEEGKDRLTRDSASDSKRKTAGR